MVKEPIDAVTQLVKRRLNAVRREIADAKIKEGELIDLLDEVEAMTANTRAPA